MAALIDRLPRWADWIIAFAIGVLCMNVNVTSAGDPLSGVGLTTDPTSPGITDGARTTFYAVLSVGGLLLVSIGIALTFIAPLARQASRLLLTTYSLVALSGVLGLLLDYRDGPVRLVQSFAYVALALGIVRLGRIVLIAADATSTEASSPSSPLRQDVPTTHR